MENTSTPTALILSRQNIANLPVTQDPYTSALQVAKGAYVVADDEGTPDVVLLASGSEVATLIEGAALLRQRDNLKVRVVSVPSEGLFRSQDQAYQKEALPCRIPRFGMTAGLSVTLAGLVGENGTVWGMNSFGYSAPYKVLDEKLGFNGENVYRQVLKLLGKG
jgi:transketolase